MRCKASCTHEMVVILHCMASMKLMYGSNLQKLMAVYKFNSLPYLHKFGCCAAEKSSILLPYMTVWGCCARTMQKTTTRYDCSEKLGLLSWQGTCSHIIVSSIYKSTGAGKMRFCRHLTNFSRRIHSVPDYHNVASQRAYSTQLSVSRRISRWGRETTLPLSVLGARCYSVSFCFCSSANFCRGFGLI